MSDDEPKGAFDTGGSAFDATRNADNPVSAVAAAPAEKGSLEEAAISDFDAAWNRAVGPWLDSLRSSPITQATNNAWGYLQDQLPRLKTLVQAEMEK